MINTVSNIWAAVGLIIMLGSLFVLAAAIFPAQSWYRRQHDREELDIQLHHERLDELRTAYQQQAISKPQYIEQEAEINQQLYTDINHTKAAFKLNNHGRYMLLGSVVLMALVAIGLYQKLGAMAQISAWQAREVTRDILAKASDENELEMQLKQALEQTPANAEGWYMLANVQMQNSRFDEALNAFTQAFQHIQPNSVLHDNLAGTYAQALFHIDKQFSDRVEKAISSALQINPNNISALSLQGIKAFEAEDYQQAIYYWQKAQEKAGEEEISALQAGIERAKSNLSDTGSTDALSLNLSIQLAKGLNLENKPNATQAVIFVYAKDAGQRAPLLARKITNLTFPNQITLSANDAIRGKVNLTDYAALDIGAHISFDGTAIRKSGDFYGELNAVQLKPDDKQQIKVINLTIDRITP